MEESSKKTKRRRGDGGTFLVVAPEDGGFPAALHYAARRAAATGGHVAIVRVIDAQDVQHWGRVEEKIRQELREEAEKDIWEAARQVNDLTGDYPVLYIKEGKASHVLLTILMDDMEVRQLVLTGGTASGGPGPLTKYFTDKGLGQLPVPVVIVPDNLSPGQIDDMT